MIERVSSGGNVGIASITALRYAQSDGQDIVMPVRPAQLVYANFKHIRVLPDSRVENGVPLYKLKILDTLIEQLSKGGNQEPSAGKVSTPVRWPGRVAALHGGIRAVDGLIADMAKELRPAAGQAASYRGGFLPEPGAFVDLVA
jgi:hypothetical protein